MNRFFAIFLILISVNSLFPEKKIDKKKPKKVLEKIYQNYFIRKDEKNFSLIMEARKFGRGEVVFLRLVPKEKKWIQESFKLVWLGKEVPLTKLNNSMIAFLPISPDTPAGVMTLEIISKIFFVKRGQKQYQIVLEPTKFQVISKQKIQVDDKFVSQELPKETLDFIQECREAKEKAFASSTDLQFRNTFREPLEKVYITSKFYVRRDYNGKKGKPHGGVDFRGKVGTPIYAIQDGTVVLAKKMYYEGNFTILDHGNRIFSFYMHQDEMKVNTGDKIKKGQLIGTVGSTGMSTGPHLHLGAKVNGILVDPQSLIAIETLAEAN